MGEFIKSSGSTRAVAHSNQSAFFYLNFIEKNKKWALTQCNKIIQ